MWQVVGNRGRWGSERKPAPTSGDEDAKDAGGASSHVGYGGPGHIYKGVFGQLKGIFVC